MDLLSTPSNKAGFVQEKSMNAFDRKLHEKIRKLDKLGEIEARLTRQETKTRVILIVMMVLATMGFSLLLGHILAPSWLPLSHSLD
jgi:hypothetical protein